ncbi:MAG TPA: ribonuclease III [Patescibacteria group bacterium]
MTKLEEVKKGFKDEKLFDQALTHKSWLNENKGKRESNERLEFLGDAILEYIVSDEIYRKFTDQSEGYLTALRANLVNTKNLSIVAQKLGVGESIYLSHGEERGGGRTNPSLLADTIEAIIGAIYIDLGIKAAKNFIMENILENLPEKIQEPLKDAKSLLQEKVQSKKLPTPRYRVIEIKGPDHARQFGVEVRVGDKIAAKGTGKSKAEAQQMAASIALKELFPEE